MDRKLFAFVTGIIMASCIFAIFATFIPDQNPEQFSVHSEKIIQQLMNEQDALHNKNLLAIKDEFKISDSDWNATFDYINMIKANDNLIGDCGSDMPKAESSFVQNLYCIMSDYRINPSRLVVKNLKGPEYKAQAFQHVDEAGNITHILELNSEWLENFSPEIQEGMLRHEIMHILNYDCLEDNYLMGMLETLGYHEKEYAHKKSIINYRRQREIRADLLACCNSFEIADALRSYYEACALESDHYLPQTWDTHPKDSQRAQKLAGLIAHLQAKPTIATA